MDTGTYRKVWLMVDEEMNNFISRINVERSPKTEASKTIFLHNVVTYLTRLK